MVNWLSGNKFYFPASANLHGANIPTKADSSNHCRGGKGLHRHGFLWLE